MDEESTYLKLRTIALEEFPDITFSASIIRGPLHVANSLRVYFYDDSFLEIWLCDDKYSYHWQRVDGRVYRHDNAPHHQNKNFTTFPRHFHNGSEDRTEKSDIHTNPSIALRQFLRFIRQILNSK